NTKMSKYYEFVFALEIDGETCVSEKVVPMYQSDPWPGGHRYSCVLSGKRVKKYFDYLVPGKNANVSDELAFRFIHSLALSWREDDNVVVEYFLNNVNQIDFDGAKIHFSGVCSPVVR